MKRELKDEELYYRLRDYGYRNLMKRELKAFARLAGASGVEGESHEKRVERVGMVHHARVDAIKNLMKRELKAQGLMSKRIVVA